MKNSSPNNLMQFSKALVNLEMLVEGFSILRR